MKHVLTSIHFANLPLKPSVVYSIPYFVRNQAAILLQTCRFMPREAEIWRSFVRISPVNGAICILRLTNWFNKALARQAIFSLPRHIRHIYPLAINVTFNFDVEWSHATRHA